MNIGTSKIRWSRIIIRGCWIVGSSAALVLGAAMALAIYPEAGFAETPSAQFGWHLVGFVLSVGLPLALLQCLILALALPHYSSARIVALLLWIPVTSGGIAAMSSPLWWIPSIVFVFAPPAVLLYMLPGMAALGIAQWLIVRSLFNIGPVWITYTMVGAVIGAVLGLNPFVFALAGRVLPLEVIWAGVTGAAMGALQARGLVRAREEYSS